MSDTPALYPLGYSPRWQAPFAQFHGADAALPESGRVAPDMPVVCERFEFVFTAGTGERVPGGA
jgi:hypothetical protein